jgi:hypothetical protein
MIEGSGWPKNMRTRWIRIRNTACRIWGRKNVLVASSPCLDLPLLAAHKAGEVLSCVGNGRHLVAACQQVHEFQLVQPQFWDTQALSVQARKSGNSLMSVLWIRDFQGPRSGYDLYEGKKTVRTENYELKW